MSQDVTPQQKAPPYDPDDDYPIRIGFVTLRIPRPRPLPYVTISVPVEPKDESTQPG